MVFTNIPMPTPEEHYAFLKNIYHHLRFEGRNGASWGEDYSRRIAAYRYAELLQRGHDLISEHETATRETVFYLRDLTKFENMSDLASYASNIDGAVAITVTIPANVTGLVTDDELASRVEALTQHIRGVNEFCRVTVNIQNGPTSIEVVNASESDEVQIHSNITTQIEAWISHFSPTPKRLAL